MISGHALSLSHSPSHRLSPSRAARGTGKDVGVALTSCILPLFELLFPRCSQLAGVSDVAQLGRIVCDVEEV